MQDILVIGPQGAGKGTQSMHLSEKLGVPHVSLGTLFRQQIAASTPLGLELKGYVEQGMLAPPELAAKIMTERLSRPDAAKGVIIDGFPRNLAQADMLDNILNPLGRVIAHVLYLNISDAEAHRRLGGRRVCTNGECERNYHVEMSPTKAEGVCDHCGAPVAARRDDVPEAIDRRLAIYHAETVPLIELYRGTGVLREIAAERTIDEVRADLHRVLGAA